MLEPYCRLVTSNFSDVLDGQRLPLAARFWTRLHLTLCPRCKRTFRSLKETKSTLARLREVQGGESIT